MGTISQVAPHEIEQAANVARQIRAACVDLSFEAGTPHLASSLSCADIVACAYTGPLDLRPELWGHSDRNRFILSKGHAATALYAALCFAGYFSENELQRYAKEGSLLGEQPIPHSLPGIEVATGSLGHGLSLGVGMALAARIRKCAHQRVVCLLSDGECNEGSVWEAAMFASAQRLAHLSAIVDFNKWQATGRSQEVMALDPLADKWRSFGWQVSEIDGHDHASILAALRETSRDGAPVVHVAHTVKGRGVSFMEDDNNWHYRIPSREEVELAKREIFSR